MLAAGPVTTKTHKVSIHVSFGVFAMFRAFAATGNKGVNGTFWEYAIFRALARVAVRRAVNIIMVPVAVRDAVRGAAARIGVTTGRIQTLVASIVGRAVAALIVTIVLRGPHMLAAGFSVIVWTTIFRAFAVLPVAVSPAPSVVSTTMSRAFVVLPVAVIPALLVGRKKNNGHSQKRSQCQDDRSHSQGPLDCTPAQRRHFTRVPEATTFN